MKRSFKIYKITCKINNKVYIGQTIETLTQRFNRHMGYQKEEHDTKFYRAVRKYGKEIRVFNSIKALQKYHNVTTDYMVIARCKGKTKSPYKGYNFKYYEDYIEGQSTIESIAKEKYFSE